MEHAWCFQDRGRGYRCLCWCNLHTFSRLDCLTLLGLWVTSKRAPPFIEGGGERRFAAADSVVVLLCTNSNAERSEIFHNEKGSSSMLPSHSFLFALQLL